MTMMSQLVDKISVRRLVTDCPGIMTSTQYNKQEIGTSNQ